MRTISATALALVAGLAFAGAASADEYLTNANRENYASSAQGFIPSLTAQRAANEALLPASAQGTARVLAQAASVSQSQDPHWGPALEGTPSQL
ncbi:hypothetical protein [Azorhizobium caulinodans]|uniref:hypothetical protein n=1 Tax=Azorhizobium caulinodans TaxID=7 RepID=UPI002FBE8895